MPPTRQKHSFVLTCGSPIRTHIDPKLPYPQTSPGKPVPSFLPTPTRSPAKSDHARPSTGCGATIHLNGTRDIDPSGTLWRGEGRTVGSTVVFLPPEYFTNHQKTYLGGIPRMDVCGCVTVGVGCCLCGNVLGSLTTLCEDHAGSDSDNPTFYNFLPESVSPPLPDRPRNVKPRRTSTSVSAAPAPLIRRSSSFRWASTLPGSVSAPAPAPAPTPIRRAPSLTPQEIEMREREADAIRDEILAEHEYKLEQQQAAAERFYAAEGVPRTDRELRAWVRRAMGRGRNGGFER